MFGSIGEIMGRNKKKISYSGKPEFYLTFC